MTRNLLAAALALLGTASLASAGPIAWDYSAHVRTKTGTGVLNLGTHAQYVDPSGTGTGEPVFSDYTYYADFSERTVTGDFNNAAPHNNEFNLFFTPEYQAGVRSEVAPAVPMDSSFLVSLTLTDRASGQSGVVELEGSVGMSVNNEYPGPVLYSLGLGPATTELVLGGNRYTVHGVGGKPDELDEPAGAWVAVDVTAGAAAVQTPEPTTLALAALGLAAVGVRRGRKPR